MYGVSVAGEFGQLRVAWVELPELRTQLDLVQVGKLTTTVVTAFGSPLS